MKFKKLRDGELSPAIRRRKDDSFVHDMKCCDCGLVHRIRLELTKSGALRFRAWRMNHKDRA